MTRLHSWAVLVAVVAAGCGWWESAPAPDPQPASVQAPSDPSSEDRDADGLAPVRLLPIDDSPTVGLRNALRSRLAEGRKAGRQPFLFVTSPACPFCRELLDILDTEPMQDALRGVTLLHLDVPVTSPWIDDPMLSDEARQRVPAFHAIDEDGDLGAVLTGDSWGDTVPGDVAPILALFLRSHGVDLPVTEELEVAARRAATRAARRPGGAGMVPVPGGIPEGAVLERVEDGFKIYSVPDDDF